MIVQMDDTNTRSVREQRNPDSDGAEQGLVHVMRLYGALEPWTDKTCGLVKSNW